MPYALEPWKKNLPLPSFTALRQPISGIIDDAPALTARGNRDLQMTFEQQLNSLIFFHLEEPTSGRHLVQVLAQDDWARKEIAPPEGIQKSSYFEAINTRGLEQLIYIYQRLVTQTAQGRRAGKRSASRLLHHPISRRFIKALSSPGRLPPPTSGTVEGQ